MGGEKVVPFLKYVGGKRRLAKRIVSMLPPHTCYVEPFGGMGAVLLAKPKSKVEAWNDINQGLANVMRVVRYHPDALAARLGAAKGRWILTYGDHPLIRELYAGCRIEEVRRVRTIEQDARREYVELIITP